MSLPAAPPASTPVSVREGSRGWLVYGVQIMVGAAADGTFGPLTKKAVIADQKRAGIEQDGVVGPVTQRVYAKQCIVIGEQSAHTPAGLIRGLVENESGLMLAAVNWTVRGGVDCGIVQRRVTGPAFSLAALKAAFDPRESCRVAAVDLARLTQAFARPHTGCPFQPFELAALHHNWPAAAQRFHDYGHLPYPSRSADWAPASLQPMTWDQWAHFYVQQATRYVGK